MKKQQSKKLTPNSVEMAIWDWGKKNNFTAKSLGGILAQVRLSSFSRLLGSFLRENIGDVEKKITYYDFDLWQKQNAGFFPNNRASILNKMVIEIDLGGSKRFIALIRRAPLRRFVLLDLPIEANKNVFSTIDNISHFSSIIFRLGKNESGNWQQFKQDVLSSHKNLFFETLLREKSADNLDSIKQLETRTPDETEIFFEQQCVLGHPFHPTPKSKPGVSFKILERYLHESNRSFDLYILVIKKEHTIFFSNGLSFKALFQQLSINFYSELCNFLKEKGLNPKDYHIIPVHPWQYERLIRKTLPGLIDQKDFFILQKKSDYFDVLPLVAFRTVFSKSLGVYFKLPVKIKMTSANRTLSSKPCRNGVALNNVLHSLAKDSLLHKSLKIQKEILSVRLNERVPLYKNLSFVLRESCKDFARKGDLIIPAMALFEKSPWGKSKYILDDVLSLFQRTQDETRQNVLIASFFESYVKATVLPVIDLLTKHGIGLESHLQNSLIVFRQGVPSFLIYRDLDAVDICKARINKKFLSGKYAFYPGSWAVSDDIFFAQDKVMHSLFHAHIAEIIILLSNVYKIPEQDLWIIVKTSVRNHLGRLKNIRQYKQNAIQDLEFYFRDKCDIKCLFRMKLEGKTNEYIRLSVDNPLKD